ncbi:DNA-3-methyladenine glycosylase [Stenotrophomonas panacihumi]|uniref:DNA-3-methyladenine glycosylase n=1 Tax=Stenotrophomonas panacihumi TaxID=676599 RepID=A0A0R0AC54_9GAMM|nr:alpha-ketoglutarate-dependent dioxygenase AlkB [Stenotrophomonas panacihumi]KRG42383.1 DNA-3-methyladenine glycosylase [Stenotrophomonas panacihumi]PTN54655.1 alpha-ketoglutarate-dependent dioxygenase AlkB [Stenotrophomonas panacihumi]
MPVSAGACTCADLFDSAPYRTVVADAEGGVRYWPQWVGQAQAEDWFAALRDGIEWQTLQRPMYERIVDVPRLLAHFELAALPAGSPLARMWAQVNATVPGAYTHAGLNLYRDGRDSVAMHNDKLHSLVPGEPIALVSLGDTRRMNLRAKDGGRACGLDLAPGSLLAMSHASQLTHEHGIPKTARPVGPRMSVVFRARPQAAR